MGQMDRSNDGGNAASGGRQRQKTEAASASAHLQEKIAVILSRWHGLQLAVQNQWGGRDSLQKSNQLAADIFSWLFQSQVPLHQEELENLLHEIMLLSFRTDIEDGSIEEVAEELMAMHEEYLHGN